MAELIESGRFIDLILLMVAIEFLVLLVVLRRRANGVRIGDFTFTLLSGACLLVALRFAITGADWRWILLWLTAAVVAHFCDLLRLFRR